METEANWCMRKDGGEEAIMGPLRLSVSPHPENKPWLEVETEEGYKPVTADAQPMQLPPHQQRPPALTRRVAKETTEAARMAWLKRK